MYHYYVGWNVIGQPPEVKPQGFETHEDARRFLRDEIRWMAEDEIDEVTVDLLYEAASYLEMYPSGRAYRFVFGNFEYWLRKATGNEGALW